MKIYTDDFSWDAVVYVDGYLVVPIEEDTHYSGVPKGILYGWVRTAYSNKLFETNNPILGAKTKLKKRMIAIAPRES